MNTTSSLMSDTTAQLADTTTNMAKTTKRMANTTVQLANPTTKMANTTTRIANTTIQIANSSSTAQMANAHMANTTKQVVETSAQMANTTTQVVNTTNTMDKTTNTIGARFSNTTVLMAGTTGHVNETMQMRTNTELSGCSGDSIYNASVALFAVGSVLFLATVIFWVVVFCKRRRRRSRPLPLAPPTSASEIERSGEYLDLHESIDRYESINMTRVVSAPDVTRYIPRDAMHETFDGSRMPSKEAPKPPNYSPQLSTKVQSVNDTGANSYGTPSADDTELERTYEAPDPSNEITDRPPTIPGRQRKN